MKTRRSFLAGLGAIGLYPTIVRAFGPTTQIEIPKGSQQGKHSEKTGKTPARSDTDFECVVGEVGLPTSNGHIYTPQVFHKMFYNLRVGGPNRGPFAVLGSDSFAIDVNHVAGIITDYSPQIRARTPVVVARLHLMNTPYGKIVKDLLAGKAALFLTPVGRASHIGENGIIPDNYEFSHFNISNESAFDLASPLQACEDTKDPWYVPGGEQMDYVPSMKLYAKK